MQKIPIRHSKGGGTVRLANNLLNAKNEKIILDMLLEQQKHVKNYNGGGREALDKVNSGLLANFYHILANTKTKSNLIENHNGNFKHSKELYDICASDNMILNAGEGLKDDKSKDVITEDFKKCLHACEDEKMQKVAFWANRIAHGCTDEIGTFTEQYLGSSATEEEANKKRKSFLTRVAEANKNFDEKTQYKFNQSRLSILLGKDGFDFDTCTDPDFVKAKDLMKIARIPCRDASAMKNFIYCNKLQTMTNNFYAFKDNAVENLMLHLNDPQIDEDDKHIEGFRIIDKDMKGRKGEDLSRVVLVNKSMYDIYLKNNDSVNFTDKHIDSYTTSGYLHSTKKYSARNQLKQTFSDRYIDSNTMNALMEKCSVSVFHIPDKCLKSESVVLSETYPPIIESMAYNGGNIYDITPSAKKEKGLEKYLKEQEILNELNNKKYDGDSERMYSEKKIEKKAKSIIQTLENGNVRRI